MAAPSSSSGADAHPLHAAVAAPTIPSTIYPSSSTSSQSSSSSSSSSSASSSHTTSFDKDQIDFTHPVADVVSANLLVECIRLSGCEDIVKKCEALWYPSSSSASSSSNSDSISNSNSYVHASQSASTAIEKGSSSADSGLQGIGPNDYTFELMSKIWQENKCNDIASRTQTLFDRYSAYFNAMQCSAVQCSAICADMAVV